MNGATVSHTEETTWPESTATKKVGYCWRLLNWLRLMGVTQLLAIICMVLAAAVIGLGIVLGASVTTSTNQSGRLDNLGQRLNEQQDLIDHQQVQIDDLQRTVMVRSAPR